MIVTSNETEECTCGAVVGGERRGGEWWAEGDMMCRAESVVDGWYSWAGCGQFSGGRLCYVAHILLSYIQL